MFDIRKIQEQAIFTAVAAAADEATAAAVVYGEGDAARNEDTAAWVPSTMDRLERRFDRETVKPIRMACQCGYGYEEKLQLVRELMANASSMEAFAGQEAAQAAGLSCRDGVLHLEFPF